MLKTPYLKVFLVGLGVGVLALVFGASRGTVPPRGEKEPLVLTSPAREIISPPTPDANEQAEKRLAVGDYEGAAHIYEKLSAEEPKLVAIKLKLAGCLLLAGKKVQARKRLLEPAKDENLPPEVRGRLFSLLHKACEPELSSGTRKIWQQALEYLLAGEELHKTPNEFEARPERRPHYRAYARAIELIDQVLAESPAYFPAYLSLGVACENVSRYREAAQAYTNYLRHCDQSGLPRCEQTSEVEKRRIVAENRARADAELAQRVVGTWEAFYALPGAPFPEQGNLRVLLEGGTVQGQPGQYWRVVDGFLIVWGGKVGDVYEWCDAGRLRVNGWCFDGLTQGLDVARYRKKL
jgi:hypothetical protein